jgi:hypothetical protein
MADLNPSTNIAAFVQTIYEDAMLVVRENALATSLVTVYSDRSGTAARTRSDYGTATIQSIGEIDDMTSQAFSPTAGNSLTPSEVGAQFFLTDLRVETDPFPVRSDAAMELGMAVADKIDRDIFSKFSSLTGGTVGTSGSVITWNYFAAMLARLQAQHAPKPYVFVCHPYQWSVLAKAASVASAVRTNAPEYLMEAVARNYFVANYSGVDIFVTSNVQTSGTDAYAAMFARPALAFDNRRSPRLEPERDASRRGWELNLTTVYAYGVWRATYGIQGVFDATAPAGTA